MTDYLKHTACQDGDGDEFFTDARDFGQAGGAVDEPASAKDQGRQAAQDHDERQPGGHRLFPARLFRLRFGLPRAETHPHIPDEEQQQDGAVPGAQTVFRAQAEEAEFHTQQDDHHRDDQVDGDVAVTVLPGDVHRKEDSGEAQDQERIENVGSQDIAHGYGPFSLQRANHAHHHLRGGRAHPDDGEADDELAEPQFAGDGGSAVHQVIGSHDHQQEACEQKETILQHIQNAIIACKNSKSC